MVTGKSLADYRNVHAGERIFLLGNGPSLQVADLELLTGEVTFGCNKIYLAFPETHWRPTYYTVEDHLVALQNRDEIEQLREVTKFFPHTLALHGVQFSNSLEYRFLWKDVYPALPQCSADALTGLHWGSTVLYSMLQLAFFMGFVEIYLLGVDFHFQVPATSTEATGKFQIFVSEGERNHFHPDYRRPGERWHQPNLAYQEKAFLAAREFAKEQGVAIINLTPKSKLTVFPRADLHTLLGLR